MPSISGQNVAYQPLNILPPNTMVHVNQQSEDENDNESNDDEHSILSSQDQRSQRTYRIGATPISLIRSTCLSMIQVKFVATLLFFTFLAQLITRYGRSVREKRLITENSTVNSFHGLVLVTGSVKLNKTNLAQLQYVKLKHVQHHSSENKAITHRTMINNVRPHYDNYLSSVLRDHEFITGQQALSSSLDDLLYVNDSPVNHKHVAWWTLKFRLSEKYVILENYVRSMKSFEENSTVTLTTQATTDFMYHTAELCKRWDGPISVAVYCPSIELTIALTLIKFMRQCLPEPLSACVRDKVTWHLVYDQKHGPPTSAISFPWYHMDEKNYPLFIQAGQCPKIVSSSSDTDPIKQFELELRKKNKLYPSSYRQQFRLTYPINVLRNTARETAQTKYVLASDIELYPSTKLVPQFINLLKFHDFKTEFPNIKKYVFALPIFEVKAKITVPPKTKQDLIKLIAREDAIFFHKWVCDACQDFPHRLEWLLKDSLLKQDHNHENSDDDELIIFDVTRRDKSREFWEPIFIGTKNEPEYDDRLTWDGRRDKMGQMYEMCLQDYHLFVLGNAFLVHAPGIKRLDKDDFNKRLDFMRRNNAIYDDTIARLKERYKMSDNIKIC